MHVYGELPKNITKIEVFCNKLIFEVTFIVIFEEM